MTKKRKVFAVNFKDYDFSEFKKDPIVILDGKYDIPPVGIAQYINSDAVAIFFHNEIVCDYIDYIEIKPSYYIDGNKKVLLYLIASMKAKK